MNLASSARCSLDTGHRDRDYLACVAADREGIGGGDWGEGKWQDHLHDELERLFYGKQQAVLVTTD